MAEGTREPTRPTRKDEHRYAEKMVRKVCLEIGKRQDPHVGHLIVMRLVSELEQLTGTPYQTLLQQYRTVIRKSKKGWKK